jgi:glycine oxidase
MKRMQPDVIVVGAGIIGSSIAWRLAQRGFETQLIDAGTMGGEASWAGAGMLAPGGELGAQASWAESALESLALYPEFIAGLEEESGVRIDFQRQGAIEMAASAADLEELEARAEAQQGFGIRSSKLTERELAGMVLVAMSGIAGARFYPDDAAVDPRDVMQALRSACVRRGVQIRERLRANAIRAGRTSAAVVTSEGTMEARVAVLAAGAWSGLIAADPHRLPPSFPVRGHLIGFRLPAGSVAYMLRCGHTYMLQRSNGFTIAGSSSEQVGFDRRLDPGILQDIHARAGKLLPMLANRQPDDAWLGFRPGIEGDCPVVRRIEGTTVWLAYGHYRNGILLAPATARKVAAEIMASSGMDSSEGPGKR